MSREACKKKSRIGRRGGSIRPISNVCSRDGFGETALVECLTADEAPPGEVAVIVEARDAAPTNGEAGVTLEAGPRVGRRALEQILCDANTEVVARTKDGRFWTMAGDRGLHHQP